MSYIRDYERLVMLFDAASLVCDNWESGDLARYIRSLQSVLDAIREGWEAEEGGDA